MAETEAIEGTYDVVIVGAGLAGITAARDLSADGRRILLLEARDHIGGRAWSRPFEGRDLEIPMGGTYIATKGLNYEAAWREVERYGLELEAPPAPKSVVNLLYGERLTGRMPVPPDEWHHLERVLVAFMHDIADADEQAPIEAQIPAELDVAFADYLAAHDAPARTSEYLTVRAQLSAQRSGDQFSIAMLAHQIICTGRSIANYSFWPMLKIAGGTRVLYDAILDDADVDLRLSTPVAAIEQAEDGVVVTTRGDRFVAATCVVATPVSLWSEIAFDPPLSEAKRAGAKTQPLNGCEKVWAVVKDAPPDPAGIGNAEQSEGFVAMVPDHVFEDGQLMVGFAPQSLSGDPKAVERAFQAYLPGCSVVAYDAHDWGGDPYSRGAWMAPPPGYVSRYAAEMRVPEGRLVFATSDIARRGLSNMAGAILSGTDAAEAAEGILCRATAQRMGA